MTVTVAATIRSAPFVTAPPLWHVEQRTRKLVMVAATAMLPWRSSPEASIESCSERLTAAVACPPSIFLVHQFSPQPLRRRSSPPSS